MANKFSEWSILLNDSLVLTVNNSFLFRLLNLDVSIFSHILDIVFQKLHYSFGWKFFLKTISCFFFFSSVFISVYSFNQASQLNLMTLWTFFNTGPWFSACFKCFIRITYYFLSCNLATNFSSSILSSKKDKLFWRPNNFLRYWTSTSGNYISSISSL